MRMVKFSARDAELTKDNPLLDIEWSGFPCVLIRDAAMRQLGSEAFKPIVKEGLQFGFTSEDASFWWKFREAGLKVACDLRCEVPHMKYRIIKPIFVPRQTIKEGSAVATGAAEVNGAAPGHQLEPVM